MIFKSHIATEASGSIGGTTLSHNKGGMYMRARGVPVNVNSTRQTAARAAFRILPDNFLNKLNQTQRDAWNLYAANVPMPGPLGDRRAISGQNHFIRANTPDVVADQLLAETGVYARGAPAVFDLGSFNLPVVEGIGTTTGLVYDIDIAEPWANDTGGAMYVYLRRSHNASRFQLDPNDTNNRTDPHTPWRLVDRVRGDDALPPSSTQIVAPIALRARWQDYHSGTITQIAFAVIQPDNRLSERVLGPAFPCAGF